MTAGRVALTVSSVVVVAAVAVGLYLSGSPASQRALRLDERRIDDLRRLAYAVSQYYDDTGRMPAALDAMLDGRTLSSLPRDPITSAAYGYEPLSQTRARLCAEFARAGESAAADEFWAHDAGMQCFELDFSLVDRF